MKNREKRFDARFEHLEHRFAAFEKRTNKSIRNLTNQIGYVAEIYALKDMAKKGFGALVFQTAERRKREKIGGVEIDLFLLDNTEKKNREEN